MNNYRYIHITYLPIWLRTFPKAYVLQAYLEQDGDHRWNAWVDALPRLRCLGYTQEEVLTALRDAIEVYADTGTEVIEETLSKRETRARRGRIVPLPL